MIKKEETVAGVLTWVLAIVLFCFVAGLLIHLNNIGGQIPRKSQSPCYYPRSYECYVYRIEQCIATEWGTKEQCIQLVDGYFND